MVKFPSLDSIEVQDIKQLLREGVPLVKSKTVDAESVNTDEQTINNSLTYGSHDIASILEAEIDGQRVETGTETIDMPGPSSDGTMDTNANNRVTVNFSEAFSSTPNVVLAGLEPVRPGVVTYFRSPSGTDFDIHVFNYSTNDHSSQTADIGWVAIGQD